MHGDLSHIIQWISEVCQNGADVKYNLLVVQAGVEWTGVVVLCGDVLMCLSTVSITRLICFLFTWVAYLVTFKMEIICTRLSCCWCWVAISWLTLFLILLTSLFVTVPISQLSASFKKGRRLLLIHQLKGDMLSKVCSLLRSWVVVNKRGL